MKTDIQLIAETRPKFLSMEPMFWVKYSDFMSVVHRHPWLGGGLLYTRRMGITGVPFGVGAAGKSREEQRNARNQTTSTLANGHV